jgi:hypothetical protein
MYSARIHSAHDVLIARTSLQQAHGKTELARRFWGVVQRASVTYKQDKLPTEKAAPFRS